MSSVHKKYFFLEVPMSTNIKTIEDLSLNAWPSHQIEVYDGWLLRFSYFYTHRTNSVEQIGPSTIPLDTKITYCEERYRKWGTPSIFKVTPLVASTFDSQLSTRGYTIEHTTEVMTLDLHNYTPSIPKPQVHLEKFISPAWIEGLFSLKRTTNITHRKIVPSMYQAIPKDTIAASIRENGEIIATGLGIMDRSYIGLYAIHVHPAYRGRHLGKSICQAILTEGINQNAQNAYLQVVKNNTPAQNLYHSLGFHPFYTYWFRTHPVLPSF